MSAKALNWAWGRVPELDSSPMGLVLIALADRADDDGELWPKLDWLVEKVGLGRSTVRKHVAALEERGLLVRLERTRKDGGRTSNALQLVLDPPAQNRAGPPAQNSAGPLLETGRGPCSEPGGAFLRRSSETFTRDGDVREPAGEAAEAWALYQRVVDGAERRQLNDVRRSLIRNALKLCGLELVKAAIVGLSRSPYHNGDNEQRTKYLDIRYALKGNARRGESDEERIERMAALGGREGAGINVPDWIRRNLRIYGEDGGDSAQARALGENAIAWLAERGLAPTFSGSEHPFELLGFEEVSGDAA